MGHNKTIQAALGLKAIKYIDEPIAKPLKDELGDGGDDILNLGKPIIITITWQPMLRVLIIIEFLLAMLRIGKGSIMH